MAARDNDHFSVEDLKLAVAQAINLRDSARQTRVRLRLEAISGRQGKEGCMRSPREKEAHLNELLAMAVTLTDGKMGNIQVVDERGALRLVAQLGFRQEFLEYFDVVQRGHCACGNVLRTGAQVAVENVEDSELFDRKGREIMLRAKARAVLSTPLKGKGRVCGILSVHFDRPRRFSSQDKQLFDVVGAELGKFLDAEHAWDGGS